MGSAQTDRDSNLYAVTFSDELPDAGECQAPVAMNEMAIDEISLAANRAEGGFRMVLPQGAEVEASGFQELPNV